MSLISEPDEQELGVYSRQVYQNTPSNGAGVSASGKHLRARGADNNGRPFLVTKMSLYYDR